MVGEWTDGLASAGYLKALAGARRRACRAGRSAAALYCTPCVHETLQDTCSSSFLNFNKIYKKYVTFISSNKFIKKIYSTIYTNYVL
jgi:hypothetical protein